MVEDEEKKKDEEEESDLVSDIKEEEIKEVVREIREKAPDSEINERQFQTFMQSSDAEVIESSAPVLNKVAEAPNVNLEETAVKSPKPLMDNPKVMGEPKYVERQKSSADEIKYEEPIKIPLLRERRNSNLGDVPFRGEEEKQMDFDSQEVIDSKLIDTRDIKPRMNLPFEEDRKYKEF